MRIILYLAVVLLNLSFLAAFTALVMVGFRPVQFAALLNQPQYGPWRRTRRALVITFGTLALLGVALMLYAGAHLVLAWMPGSWGTVDEDGDFQPIRDSIAGAAGIIGAVVAGHVVEKIFAYEARISELKTELTRRLSPRRD